MAKTNYRRFDSKGVFYTDTVNGGVDTTQYERASKVWDPSDPPVDQGIDNENPLVEKDPVRAPDVSVLQTVWAPGTPTDGFDLARAKDEPLLREGTPYES